MRASAAKAVLALVWPYFYFPKKAVITVAKKDKWIQEAVSKHPGALTKKAKKAGAVTKEGTISKEWIAKKAKSGDKTTQKQAQLAKTLGKLGKRKKGS